MQVRNAVHLCGRKINCVLMTVRVAVRERAVHRECCQGQEMLNCVLFIFLSRVSFIGASLGLLFCGGLYFC